MERNLHKKLISVAQQQYKLAVAVKIHCNATNGKAFATLDDFTIYGQVAEKAEFELTPHQEKFASAALEHSAIYIMAVQIDTALENCFNSKGRFKHPDSGVVNASCIARLIRNAFAHDPFNPVWLIRGKCDKKKYVIDGVISLDTSNKHNKAVVTNSDYGGPLALLRFAEYVKTVLLTN